MADGNKGGQDRAWCEIIKMLRRLQNLFSALRLQNIAFKNGKITERALQPSKKFAVVIPGKILPLGVDQDGRQSIDKSSSRSSKAAMSDCSTQSPLDLFPH